MPTVGMRVSKGRVEVYLQWGQIGKLRDTRQELCYVKRCHPHIPWGQVQRMCGAAEEVRSLGMLGRWPTLQSGGGTGASNSNWIGAGRGHLWKTGAAAEMGKIIIC